MPGRAADVRAWAAAQWWRLRMLARDLGRLVAGAAATLAWALRPGRTAACVALLAADSPARVGAPNPCRVRVYNPGPGPCRLRVVLTGRCDASDGTGFELAWEVALERGGALERRLHVGWDGGVTDDPGGTASEPLMARGRVAGRWTVEARVSGAAPLVVGGVLLA